MEMTIPYRFNMAHYFLDRNLEEGRGEKVAIRYQDQEITYRQVVDDSHRMGNVLRDLGIEMEDRVLIALPDCPEFAATWFGTLKIGAVFAMVNPRLQTKDYEYYLDYSRAKVLVCDEEVRDKIRPIVKDARYLKKVVVRGVPDDGQLSYEETMRKASSDLPMADTTRDDVAGWLFTSGSTGHPKANIHRHHDFPYNTERYAKQVLEMREDDICLSVAKLFFGYATGTNLMFPFAVGGTAALFEERSTPEAIFENISRYRPTVLTNVPTTINKMVQHPDREKYDLSCIRVCLSAGEALPPDLYKKWKDAFGVEILDGIGSAEMFHIYISNRFGEVKPGSLGKLVPGYEARIVGPDHRNVPQGEIGALWVKGGSAAVGYFNDHEKSMATFKGEWCISGDQFRQDEDGCFWYGGRGDDLLKVGGIFVSPVEIESCLIGHPAVAECAVIGFEEEGLVKPKAFIVPAPGKEASDALAAELQEFVKKTIAPFKFPRKVEFIEAIPRNDRGKIDRKSLKARDA
ncbi:MAG: benzoate-CoA ligase family protein [Planctomycetota bacterium]|nr:benzoate-CoA ligase family protein [Planctomycetota bacterium]